MTQMVFLLQSCELRWQLSLLSSSKLESFSKVFYSCCGTRLNMLWRIVAGNVFVCIEDSTFTISRKIFVHTYPAGAKTWKVNNQSCHTLPYKIHVTPCLPSTALSNLCSILTRKKGRSRIIITSIHCRPQILPGTALAIFARVVILNAFFIKELGLVVHSNC